MQIDLIIGSKLVRESLVDYFPPLPFCGVIAQLCLKIFGRDYCRQKRAEAIRDIIRHLFFVLEHGISQVPNKYYDVIVIFWKEARPL